MRGEEGGDERERERNRLHLFIPIYPFILGAMIALHHRCAAPPSQSLISLTQAR